MASAPRNRDAGRQREVRQCLESWQVAQGSSVNVALNVDNIGLAALQSAGYTPQPSPDRTLAAFAQLAVLRLGVERAMVSLIDASTQTILAEATQDDNLVVAGNPRPPQNLWLGTTTLARHDAVCEHCLGSSYTATSTSPDGIQHSYTGQAFVVPDCSKDPRFQNRPYVRGSPFIRFYAGVPIISRSGHHIGAYAVSDGKVRDGLSIQDVQFMQGMAQTIMEHLEWARDRVDRFKGERLVRGLATFIESASGGSGDGSHSRTASLNPSRKIHSRPPPQMTITSPRHPLSRQTSYFGNQHSRSSSTVTADDVAMDHLPDGDKRPPRSPALSERQKSTSKGRSSKKAGNDAMSTMLGQAADILCQSTLADGVVLLGASASSSRQTAWDAQGHGRHSSDEDEPSSMPSPDGDSSSGLPADLISQIASPASFRAEKLSRVLAYAINDPQTRASFEQGQGALTLGTLDRYYARFPKGKVFSFTGNGNTITSEDDSSASERDASQERPHRSAGNTHANRPDHTELLNRIPGAKTVIFVPLFDHTENSFSGGCFLWTSVTGRLMNLDDDLSYLRAFANSITSQVARINAQKNEAAKTTFIASMSHELRSPLHGILGAAEFLADTTTADSFQAGLVSSISTCGKTLLDTLNHVLDYSKINRLGRSRLRRSAKNDKPIAVSSDSLDSLNLTAVVDLSAMVEEVVDAIIAGHTFKKPLGPTMPNDTDSTPPAQGSAGDSDGRRKAEAVSRKREEPVSVIVDISPPGAWMVRTQPGALRRIVMNLFGNSLKYTSSGYILVSLSMKQTNGDANTEILVRVIDTGKGMSVEFQRDRLFVPFMQEDSFQPGTGLGLSIVKQIVDSLGGSVDVTSEQGKGTEIDVRASLPTVPEQGLVDRELAWIRKHARGLTMVILDSDIERQAGKGAARHVNRLNQTITKTCDSWFGLNVLHEKDGAGLDADIYMYCEPPTMDTLEQRFRHDKTLSSRKWQIPVIIVCLDAQEVLRISKSQKETLTKGFGRIVELIPQPCGPRKLAKVIELCLRKAEELAGMPGPTSHALSAPVHLESLKKGPTLEEKQRRDGMTDKDRAEDVLQYDPTSIPVRPMEGSWGPKEKADAQNGQGRDDADTMDGDSGSQPQATRPQTSDPSNVTTSGLPTPASTGSLDGQEEPPAAGSTVMKEDSPAQRPKDQKLHVLLVDDNKINLQLLVMFMKKSGFSYEGAEDGQEALDKYMAAKQDGKGKRFDWVLMDISMPVMDGIESTTRIRAFERKHDLEPATIVALTGLASEDAQRNAKAAGVDMFMAKPVRFAALKKQMLETHAATQEKKHEVPSG